MGNEVTNINEYENKNENEIKKEYNLDDLSDLITKGKYSYIYKSKTLTNEIIAIKVINKSKILNIMKIINQNDLEKNIEKKLKIMKSCGTESDYSIKIINNINIISDYYITMEYCDMDLKKYISINNRGNLMKINTIKDIFLKLNKLLEILANNKKYHGDIKPEHILILEKDGKIIPKLIDYFNFNSLIKNYSLYTAPEIINEDEKIDIKSDLWSIGLILYELYFNELPFKTIDDIKDIYKNKKKLNLLRTDKDKDFNDLFHRLLKINVNERISFNGYINHNFWSSHNKNIDQITSPKSNGDILEYNEEISKEKEIIFEFKTDKFKKELEIFSKNDFKELEIFKYSNYASKKSDLKDAYIMKWISKLKFPNLRKIDLNGNNFESIEGLGNMELYMLTDLNLSLNKISDITELSKMKFENLTTLDLSQNQISNIDILTKVNFDYLSILNLSENKVSNLSSLNNFNFNYLTILNLGFNQINNIDIFSDVNFYNLNILYLNNNQIEDINVFSKIPFEKLEILNLSNNYIKEIGPIKNSKLKKLKILNLSFNKIEEIKNLKNFPFSNLETLNLSFNKLSNINAFENIKFKSIKKISFYGNNDINFDSIYVKDIIDELKGKKINVL